MILFSPLEAGLEVDPEGTVNCGFPWKKITFGVLFLFKSFISRGFESSSASRDLSSDSCCLIMLDSDFNNLLRKKRYFVIKDHLTIVFTTEFIIVKTIPLGEKFIFRDTEKDIP